MSSDLDALWREFEAETDEHLETLERLLVGRGASRTGEEIGAVFRAFHSLKGAFAVMGLPNAEAVAHKCEDILAVVRDGNAPLSDDLEKLLLNGVDELKEMRELVAAKRTDAPPARQLIARLEDYHQQIARGLVPSGVSHEQQPHSLGSDPEMISIFCELLDQRLPELAQALSSDAQQSKQAAEAAANLANGAEVLSFEALADSLKTVAAFASGEVDRDRSALIASLNDIRMQVSLLEEAAGAFSGTQALANALTLELGPDYREALSRLAAALMREKDDQGTILSTAASSRMIAASLAFEHAVSLLILLEEQQSRLANGELPDSPRLLELAGTLVDALSEAAGANRDVDPGVAASLSQLWHSALGTGSASRPPAGANAPGGPILRPEFRATLSAEQVSRVEQAIAEGKRVFEILIDLESDPETSASILSWLTSAVEAVTSRTVFREGKSYFEFLILSEKTSEWLQEQLKELDPERLCIEEAREAAGEDTAPPAKVAAAPAAARAAANVRVRSDVIDRLMAEVGEMRSILGALSDGIQNGSAGSLMGLRVAIDQFGTAPAGDLRAKVETVERDFHALAALQAKLERAHRRIWEAGLQLRVVPLDALFTRLARAVRDVSDRLNKPVEVQVQGADVRIDKRIVDALVDPLMHMVRNAIDHGIESAERRTAAGKPVRGQVRISAIERGNKVQLTIADDGRGLDKPRIVAKAIALGFVSADEAARMTHDDICRLLLRPGFSTAETVTEVSGRGVGMDVVAAALQRLGGSVDVQTKEGLGATFTLTIPLSASLLRSLLVTVYGHIFAIPERQIIGVAQTDHDAIETIGENRFCAYRHLMIPVHALGRLLGLSLPESPVAPGRLVIVFGPSEPVALEVDGILRFQDLFLKELHPILADVPAIAGAAALGDGRPVLVLDVQGLTAAATAQSEVTAQTAVFTQ